MFFMRTLSPTLKAGGLAMSRWKLPRVWMRSTSFIPNVPFGKGGLLCSEWPASNSSAPTSLRSSKVLFRPRNHFL